jgi:hypothetical protein
MESGKRAIVKERARKLAEALQVSDSRVFFVGVLLAAPGWIFRINVPIG